MMTGQKVVCVSEDFPVIGTSIADKSGVGTHPEIHPRKGEVLTIDETLGDYLRFLRYDMVDEVRWWHSSRFRPLDEVPAESIEEFELEPTKETP